MLKIKNLLYFACLFICVSRVFAQGESWKEYKSTHFICYYKNADERFIENTASKAEDYYNSITGELGFRRFDFWTWDNRARIYIYDSAKDYSSATRQPVWSGGCVVAKEKAIYSYSDSENFFEAILPHEMGHVIFRELVGFNNPAVPLWLDEGVASFQQKAKYSQVKETLRYFDGQGKLMDINRLTSFNLYSSGSKEEVGIFYAESFSIVEYLINKFGSETFVDFCQKLRDTRDLTKALYSAYGFNDTGELNDAWLTYILNG